MVKTASRNHTKGVVFHVLFFCLAFVLITASFNLSQVSAQQFGARSITLSTPVPSAVASHTIQFVVPNTSSIGSIVFEYCDNSALFTDPCNAPAGLNVSAAVLGSQSGNTGFSVDNPDSTNNKLVLSRAAAAGLAVNSSYLLNNVTNPSAPGSIVYVRIAAYNSTDGSGNYSNNGAVAFVVPIAFNVSVFVPPFLKLCVGLSVATNCSAASGDSLDLGTLLSNRANVGQTQFSTGTNSPSGYAIYAQGTTMTSGNNIVLSLASPAPSIAGSSQFGINLRANSSPATGQDPAGSGIATPTANYNTPNFFTFNNGDMIASSSQPSDFNRMTVSYLVNVNNSQPPGVYSTTLTYIAVAQF